MRAARTHTHGHELPGNPFGYLTPLHAMYKTGGPHRYMLHPCCSFPIHESFFQPFVHTGELGPHMFSPPQWPTAVIGASTQMQDLVTPVKWETSTTPRTATATRPRACRRDCEALADSNRCCGGFSWPDCLQASRRRDNRAGCCQPWSGLLQCPADSDRRCGGFSWPDCFQVSSWRDNRAGCCKSRSGLLQGLGLGKWRTRPITSQRILYRPRTLETGPSCRAAWQPSA